MLSKIPSLTGFQLVETGVDHFQTTVPSVLKHFDSQTIESILDATNESIENQGHRFAAVQAVQVKPLAEGDYVANEPRKVVVHELAAAYLMEYPGRLASLVGPWVASDGLAEQYPKAAYEVLQALVRTARRWDVELVQSVLEEDSPFFPETLRSVGLNKLATLYQMSLELPIAGLLANGSIAVQDRTSLYPNEENFGFVWRRYDAADDAAWLDWLDATYQGTADCPELNGIRTTRNTLDGYFASSGARQNGLDSPAWWGAFDLKNPRSNSTDFQSMIASAFMLGSSGVGLWELSYMGVAPAYRGRGLGDETLRRALLEAEKLGAKRLWLAVDDRNSVAIRIYERYGFDRSRRLQAWFLSLRQ